MIRYPRSALLSKKIYERRREERRRDMYRPDTRSSKRDQYGPRSRAEASFHLVAREVKASSAMLTARACVTNTYMSYLFLTTHHALRSRNILSDLVVSFQVSQTSTNSLGKKSSFPDDSYSSASGRFEEYEGRRSTLPFGNISDESLSLFSTTRRRNSMESRVRDA